MPPRYTWAPELVVIVWEVELVLLRLENWLRAGEAGRQAKAAQQLMHAAC
jgi:hypothetical protein